MSGNHPQNPFANNQVSQNSHLPPFPPMQIMNGNASASSLTGLPNRGPASALPPNNAAPGPVNLAGQIPLRYTTVADALAHLNNTMARTTSVQADADDRVGVELQMLQHVRSLIEAYYNLDDAKDGKSSHTYKKVAETGYRVEDVHARCFQLFDEVIKYHRGGNGNGIIIPDDLVKASKEDTDLMCSRRLEEIVNAMVEMKATCKDIMDGYKIPLIVQGPIGYLKAKLQNAQGNKKKAWILQAGTAVAGVTNGRKRGGSQRATSSNSPAPSQPALAGCSPQTASPFTNGGPADSTSYPNTLKRNRSTSVDEEPVGRHVPRPRNDPLSSYQPGFQSLPPAYQRLHTASDSNAAPQFSAYSWGLPPLPPQGHSNTTAAQQGFDSFTRASQQGSQPMYGNGNGGAGRAQSQYQYPGGYASNSPYPPHNDDDQ